MPDIIRIDGCSDVKVRLHLRKPLIMIQDSVPRILWHLTFRQVNGHKILETDIMAEKRTTLLEHGTSQHRHPDNVTMFPRLRTTLWHRLIVLYRHEDRLLTSDRVDDVLYSRKLDTIESKTLFMAPKVRGDGLPEVSVIWVGTLPQEAPGHLTTGQDGTPKGEMLIVCVRVKMKVSRHGSGRCTPQSYFRRVTSKRRDIVLHPLDCESLIV